MGLLSALEDSRNLLMVGAGASGIAPLRAALEWVPVQARAGVWWLQGSGFFLGGAQVPAALRRSGPPCSEALCRGAHAYCHHRVRVQCWVARMRQRIALPWAALEWAPVQACAEMVGVLLGHVIMKPAARG